MQWRNPSFNAAGGIDCEIDHPHFGWVPFTVDPAEAPDLDNDIRNSGGIAAYVPPAAPDPRLSARLDRATFCKALRSLGLLPANEAAQAARGEWPATFAAFVSGLTADEASNAEIDWACAANIHYSHPLLQQLALAHHGGDQAQATATLDAIFGIA